MKFALRQVVWPSSGRRGFALCDPETGEIVDGQTSCATQTTIGRGGMTTVELKLFNLPVFPEEKQMG